MKKSILLSTILLITGCSVKTTTLNSYDLSTNSSISSVKHHKNRVLKVKYPSALDALGSSKIFYKRDGITSYYLYSQWSAPLNRLIYSQLIKNLSNSNSFKSVVGYSSEVSPDLNLETQIIDFYNVVEGEDSYADISIKVRLINAKNEKIVKEKLFHYKLKVEELNAKSFISTAKMAIEEFNRDLVKFLESAI